MHKLPAALACVILLAASACGRSPGTGARTGAPSSTAAQPASIPPSAAAPPAAAAQAPQAPTPSMSVVLGAGTVAVSVTGLASGAHEVHVHRDCTGNPDLHVTTLGSLLVNAAGAGSQTFSLDASLRGRGFDLLVYPLGASQGQPDLCTRV